MATQEQISVRAHNRRVDEQHERLRRQVASAKEKILRETTRLEAGLLDDPIRVAGMRYSESDGFSANSITIETDMFNFTFSFLPGASTEPVLFAPPEFKIGSARVRPLSLFVSKWATFVPVAIENYEVASRIALNWVKERSPRESKVCLVDRTSGEYYYPIDTDLKGDVIAGVPRVGMLAFEPFRRATSSVSLHFSGVKLTPKRGSVETFDFACASPELASHIESVVSGDTLRARLHAELDRIVEEALTTIEEQRRRLQMPMPTGGCLVWIVAFPLVLGVGVEAARRITPARENSTLPHPTPNPTSQATILIRVPTASVRLLGPVCATVLDEYAPYLPLTPSIVRCIFGYGLSDRHVP
jgi:hypothetical protein